MLSAEDIKAIGEADDFHIAQYREDGKTPGTLTWIWSVVVDGKLYVRAYNGTSSKWYKSAMKQGAGVIRSAGIKKVVRFVPVHSEINDRIDQAYREKYSDSPYLSPMISKKTREATVEVI